jgi:hypothetical protein
LLCNTAITGDQTQDEYEHALASRIIRAAVDLATAKMHGELQAEHEMAAEAAKTSAKKTRGIGSVTRLSIIASYAVIYDTLGTRLFPKDQARMAKAICDKASEMKLIPADAPLNPESRPVRDVAAAVIEGHELMEPEKPPATAGSRRTRSSGPD